MLVVSGEGKDSSATQTRPRPGGLRLEGRGPIDGDLDTHGQSSKPAWSQLDTLQVSNKCTD